jgi:hypothetical protein
MRRDEFPIRPNFETFIHNASRKFSGLSIYLFIYFLFISDCRNYKLSVIKNGTLSNARLFPLSEGQFTLHNFCPKPGFHMVVTVVKIESRSFSTAEIQLHENRQSDNIQDV